MVRSTTMAIAALAWMMLTAQPSGAYVDMAPTLARIVREAQTITVAEVVAFSPEKGAVILKKIRDLKGEIGRASCRERV